MSIENYIDSKVIDKIQQEIEKAQGNEIFFRGIPDEEGIVMNVEVIARGNEYSVAALLNMMKKNEVIIHNHPSGTLQPSQNDVNISSVYGSSGGASYIINNDVDDIYIIVPLKKKIKINIDKYFGKKGEIHKNISTFEVRDEQYDMSKNIEYSMNENKKIIIEAGTGTGKTIAYLLPSIIYAIENNLKVIVSTNTINLQEQLINKDIPLIEKIMKTSFTYSIVKGRGNYLCKRKLHNINEETDKDLTEAEKVIIQNMKEWDKSTRTGDRSELKNDIQFSTWEKINAEMDLCTGVKCPYYSECFFFKARKNISESNLLILNHHMFFADLSIRNDIGFNTDYSILPNYDVVIFDEAHNIEDTARNYFTYEITRFNFGKIIGYIHNRRASNSNNSGSLTKMMVYLNNILDPSYYEKIDEDKEDFLKQLDLFYDLGINILDKIIYPFAQELGNGELKKRLDKDNIKKSMFWKDVLNVFKDFKHIYSKLNQSYNRLVNNIDNLELEDEDGIVFDFKKYYDRVKRYYKNFEFILEGKDENFVYWISISPQKNNIKLYATPFDVSEELNDNLFSKMDRIIFTSATLSVDNQFNYFKESIGLNKENVIEKIIESPFDYKKQMKIYLPDDIKDPNSQDFVDSISVFLKDVIEKTKGHCFLLFTSYSQMQAVYNVIVRTMNIREYTIIKQGDYTRHEMIDVFKNSKNPILLGTDSFWEGVDVQGDQLKSVIIVKLPFKVPGEPVLEAILEYLKKKKKNPFNDYQVPQAVIKFKQGVGRLIRSKSDKGIIVVLDNRIVNKNYGEKFLKSLPDTKILKGSKNDILNSKI